jgi:cell division protein FtsX
MDTGTVTLVTVIAGFLYQTWRDERRRKWDVEDRLAIALTLAQHTTQTATTLAEQQVATAATVAEALAVKTTETAERLAAAIADNTKISTDAFHEANTVNLKLQAIGLEHNALDQLGLATPLSVKKL